MKKKTCMWITAAMAAAILSGCSGGSSQTKAPESSGGETTAAAAAAETTAEATADKSSLKGSISFWDGNWNEATFEKIKELWEKEYPNVELKAEFFVDKGMSDKYMLSLQNGSAPDVLSCALDWTTTFGSAGLLEPLNSYISAEKFDTSPYVQGAIDASTIGNDLVALPFRSETYALFYNKDILGAAGYDKAPETWDEVKEIAEKVTKDDVAGYGVCGTNYGNYSFQYITMLRSSGGDVVSEDLTKSELGSDVALQTAQLYYDLSKFAPASMLENDNIANRTLFANGKLAMYLSGVYDVPEILKANPELNFACAMVPTANGAERSTILGGWSVAISKTSKNKELAWEFIKFLTRSDIAAVYTNTFTGTQVPSVSFDGIDPAIIQPNADALKFAKALPRVGNIVGIRQAIFDDLSPTLSDSMSVGDAVKKLEEDTNNLLK